jgi:short-subunit dehydrogenase involved in D-alanine esterification of teichoic acids
MSENIDDKEWTQVKKEEKPDTVSRRISEMSMLYRNMKNALYSPRTMRTMLKEFAEVIELVQPMTDEERNSANNALQHSEQNGSLVEILRIVTYARRMNEGKK